MTDQELDRLADAIARALIAAKESRPGQLGRRNGWLPNPIRPEPPTRGGEPPAWAGAAQRLTDVAPSRSGEAPRHRVAMAETTVAVRAAAAGKGTPNVPRAPGRRAASGGRRRGEREPSIDVRIGISNRHVHLSADDVRTLFGSELIAERDLSQPGQFAARQRVDVQGPSGALRGVRVVGPARGRTQLELSPSDCRSIGVAPPVRASGALEGSIGGVSLIGSAGSVRLQSGVIIPARHLHLSDVDARAWGLRDGDLLEVRCGSGSRAVTLHDVIVRAGQQYATELHLDADEAHAAGVRTGDRARILAWHTAPAQRRPLITERDVVALARDGRTLPADAILTPSARDRARALRLLTE